MKIAIYEPVHLDWILPLCELFLNREDQISFFTSSSFKEDIKNVLDLHYQQFSFTYYNEPDSRSLFRRKLQRFFNSADFDLILLNSVDSRHLFLYEVLRKKTARIIINVHDVNNFFQAKFSFHPKKLARALGKKLIGRVADAYLVNAQSMQEYIVANKLTTKPVYWLPPVVTKAKFPEFQKKPFIITVPGSIDEKRRDYRLVLSVFEQLSKLHSHELQLILAGRPVEKYGEEIIKAATQLKQNGLAIRFFTEEVPEHLFQEIISQTTLLWSPLRIKTAIHDKINESYGTTKVSGNIYDSIRHGKPLLIPESIPVPEEIQTGCSRYSSKEDVLHKLQTILNNKTKFNEISLEAYHNAQEFSLETGLARLEKMLHEVMSLTHLTKHEHQPKK